MLEFIAEHYRSILGSLGIAYLAAQVTGYVYDRIFPPKEE